MKKFFSAMLAIALCFALSVAVVGCSNDSGSNSSDAEVGVVYSVKEDDEGNKYAVAEKYVLSDDDAKKVANGNYVDIMVDLNINEYTEDGVTYPVKEIADSAFANQLVIRSASFGANVETFGSACLAGCANLESLTVPFVGKTADAKNDGKLLGYLFGTAAADGCSSVSMSYNASGSKSYYIPNAFKTVTVTGDKVTDYAFYGLNLETVNLSGNVEAIGNYTFYGMTSLTSYKIPASVKTVGNYAFAECANLASVDFSAATALESVGEHAFDCCDLLGYGKNYVLTLPASVTSLGAKAFYNCANLKSVDLSFSGVTLINAYTFYGCAKLESVKLHSDTTLSLGVFVGCEKLEKTNVKNLDSATGADIAFDVEDDVDL